MLSPSAVLRDPEALRRDRARLEHLAALGLDLAGKRVLEVGAGTGLRTAFFEARGCDVLSTDADPANVAEMMRRHPERRLGVLDPDRAGDWSGLGRFDLVCGYGVLDRLRDPDGALARLAGVCRGQIVLDALVQSRAWVLAALRRHFRYAYAALDQPRHHEFATAGHPAGAAGPCRAVFVGSKSPLALPGLAAAPPGRQRSPAAAAPVPPKAEGAPARVWIAVGSGLDPDTQVAALADPSLVVHVFEPLPARFASLRQGLPNGLVHPVAVAERDGVAPFRVNRCAAASSLLPLDAAARLAWIDGHLLAEERTLVVPTVRLETFLAEAGIGRVERLTVDACGSDLPVVASAGKRLRDIGRITLTVAATSRPLYRGGADRETVTAFLTARGFALAAVRPRAYGQEEVLTFLRSAPATVPRRAWSWSWSARRARPAPGGRDGGGRYVFIAPS